MTLFNLCVRYELPVDRLPNPLPLPPLNHPLTVCPSLERALRNFSTLTRGDIIQIEYNDKSYEIRVLDIQPETQHGGVSIVETDLEVDFAPPVGYVEPTRVKSGPRVDGPLMV